MNIEQNWKAVENHGDIDLTSMMNLSKISHFHSSNPLKTIKKNLLINIIWGTLICMSYIALFIAFPIWQVQVAIFITFVFSVWAVYTAYLQYRDMITTVSFEKSVLEELKRHRQSILQWMKTQLKVALFIYPISASGGFFLGGTIGSGKSIETIMQKFVMWLILLVVLLILTPLCHLLAKWMFKISFGKYLDSLQKSIQELEAEK